MPGALVASPSGMGVSAATSVATKAVAKQIEDIMHTQKWSDPAPVVQFLSPVAALPLPTDRILDSEP